MENKRLCKYCTSTTNSCTDIEAESCKNGAHATLIEETEDTIQSAAEKHFTNRYTSYKVRRQGFIEGAKWAKSQKMGAYTNEEVEYLVEKARVDGFKLCLRNIDYEQDRLSSMDIKEFIRENL
jgi:hypothetical protein